MSKGDMWYVYILKCEDESFYIGMSDNPQRRFLEHKNKKGGNYTKNHKVLSIVYLEKFSSKFDASKRERQLKGWRRIKKINLINSKNNFLSA